MLRLFVFVCFGCVVSTALSGDIEETTISPELGSRLAEVANVMSPITIHWTRTRTSPLSYPRLQKILRLSDCELSFMEPERVEYTYQSESVRCRYDRTISLCDNRNRHTGTRRDSLTIACNKSRFFTWAGDRPQRPTLIIDFLDRRVEKAPLAPFLVSHFFFELALDFPTRLNQLPRGIESSVSALSRNGAKLDESYVAGNDSFQLRLEDAQNSYTWSFRPSNGMIAHAFQKQQRGDGAVIETATADDFIPLSESDSVRFPQNVRIKYFGYQGSKPLTEPIFEEHYRVTSLTQETCDSTFFEITDRSPGLVVVDGTLPESATEPTGYVSYTIPGNATQLDRAIKAARSGRSTLRPIIIINVVAFCILGALYWRDQRRKGQS